MRGEGRAGVVPVVGHEFEASASSDVSRGAQSLSKSKQKSMCGIVLPKSLALAQCWMGNEKIRLSELDYLCDIIFT